VTERFSLLSANDIHLFSQGRHAHLYDTLGAHLVNANGREGTLFSLWAPNAARVSVIGEFNNWDVDAHPLHRREQSGIWEGLIAEAGKGSLYKFHVHSVRGNYAADKADPFAKLAEQPPGTASVVWDQSYEWGDGDWLAQRKRQDWCSRPVAIYEIHLGSWRRTDSHQWLNYRDTGEQLADYAAEMGFTHVEFLPVMEHPFYGSWGYQTIGYFAPTSRYGSPQDFMWLIDRLHQRGIGVILDWVPSHFPADEHGLGYFDGTHLYEYEDIRERIHPDWNSLIFDYSRPEVRSFLLSSAAFWLDQYHVDALRVDAVASMLYRDYSRRPGEWISNKYGGRENIEAIEFLRQVNEYIGREFPGAQTIAEESTAWPMVSRAAYAGGLGFSFKWDMGWMHDTLRYMAQDPYFRKYHHHELTFRMNYAFSESFVLPLSHDEVVHGKSSLVSKMPGDTWQKFASLRLLYAYMWAQPGKKLLFMGGEFAQWSEWRHDAQLDWSLLDSEPHAQMRMLVGSLNHLYRSERALHERETEAAGFQWIDCHDSEKNVISFLRKPSRPEGTVLVICNFSPVPRQNYRLGAPLSGAWKEILNTDAPEFGGSGVGNLGGAETVPIPLHGQRQSLTITLPPLAALYFRWES
jgi:1,4-alpha-glucan branching enzyme